jgi:hypothetical protein
LQKALVRAGVCGFRTSIAAASEDAQHVHLEIESDCEKIQLLAADLPLIDGYQEISDGFEGVIHQRVRKTLRGCCSGCIVQSGIFKAMQVAASLALPTDAGIQFERDGGEW